MANEKISPVVISTALGLGGRGIFPYTLWPPYRRLLRAVRETGTVVLTKSSTRFKRVGNFIPWNPLSWKYIRRLPGMGMLNAYGLTNPGAARAGAEIELALDAGFQVIPNFYPEFARGTDQAITETLETLEILQSLLGPRFRAVELNFSCPNSQEQIRENVDQGSKCSRAVRDRYPNLFVIAKLSICHPYEFAQELEALGVNALHAVNTIPYDIIYCPIRHRRSPLWQVGGGGVSGGPAFALAFKYNRELRQRVKLFLIMGCGVTGRGEVQKYLDAGADAVSMCTLALRDPGEAAKIVRAYNR
jgi:dihydroorotate dehydrogenase (NAD+) catalytic subunit